MSGWKVQKFFGDIVYDLRTRGLLPIAVLLLVGLLAVPILISRTGGDEPLSAPTAQPSAADLAPENQSAVVAYEPGLRDYRERLSRLNPKNPFRQQFAAPAADAVDDTAGAATDGSGATVVGGTGDMDDSGGTGTGVSDGGTRIIKGSRRYYFYETDVVVGEVNTPQKKINRVTSFRYLPNEATPVVSFMGAAEGPQAVFLVSQGVVGIEGVPECAPTAEACQLIALSEGETARLTYGPNGKTYSLKVTRVELVERKKLPKQ